MNQLTTQELEAIRERIEDIWFDKAYVKGDPWKGYEVRCASIGQLIAETPSKIDADFIAAARTDIPKLLAEVDRLRAVLKQIDELSDDFYNIESIDGVPTFVLRPDLEDYRDTIHEITVLPYEAINGGD